MDSNVKLGFWSHNNPSLLNREVQKKFLPEMDVRYIMLWSDLVVDRHFFHHNKGVGKGKTFFFFFFFFFLKN